MAKMTIIIDDTLEDKFRTEVFLYIGKKNGHIKQAVTEAFKMWLLSNAKQRKAE